MARVKCLHKRPRYLIKPETETGASVGWITKRGLMWCGRCGAYKWVTCIDDKWVRPRN